MRRTLNNSTHSIPGEEATREKTGRTLDGLNTMEAAIYNFEAATVYTKYLHDLLGAQEPNGHAPPIVPTNGGGRTDAVQPWRRCSAKDIQPPRAHERVRKA